MKTDGTKVKEGQFARQLSITFQKMVSFYFFVDFSNVLHLYFLVFALPLWKIGTSLFDVAIFCSRLKSKISLS